MDLWVESICLGTAMEFGTSFLRRKIFIRGCFSIACASLLAFSSGCSDKEQPKVTAVPEVPVITIAPQDLPVYVDFIGQTKGAVEADVRARVDGVLLSMNFKEGTQVTEGQLLYTIDPAPLQAKLSEAKAGLVEAETKLVKANSDLSRIRPLAAMNAVSKRDLDAAVAQQGVATSAVAAAKANVESAEINLGYTKIVAPISGIIGLTKAQIGEYVGKPPNAVVLNTVSRLDQIRVLFNVSENDYLYFARSKQKREAKDQAPVKRVLELVLSDGSVFPEKGEVLSIDSQINTSTGTIAVEAIFPNPGQLLRPGQFAKVRAMKESLDGAIVIPKKAIRDLQGLKQVLVVDKDNKVSWKTVTIQNEVGNMVSISSGLAAGDRIVPEPQLRLADGAEVKPIEQSAPASFADNSSSSSAAAVPAPK